MLICACLGLFPGVGTFLVFSYCASHITSSCGNSSESRLDLFWDLSPVASCRSKPRLPFPPGLLNDSACHHWVSPMICFFLAQPGCPLRCKCCVVLAAASKVVSLFGLIVILYCWQIYTRYSRKKSLWVLSLSQRENTAFFFSCIIWIFTANKMPGTAFWCDI